MKENIINFTNEELELIKAIHEYCMRKKVQIDECNKIYKKQYTAEEILIDREERVYKQENLLEKYGDTLLTIRVNYPGINKNNHISLGIIKVLCELVVKEFNSKILYKDFSISAEGPIITMVIKENENEVKRKAVNIEEKHSLGRCVDIDVYDKNGNGLSRSELGLAKRKCYICNDFAHNCVRSRKHDMKEIEQFINDKLKFYKEHN